jgi:hypothetical protein
VRERTAILSSTRISSGHVRQTPTAARRMKSIGMNLSKASAGIPDDTTLQYRPFLDLREFDRCLCGRRESVVTAPAVEPVPRVVIGHRHDQQHVRGATPRTVWESQSRRRVTLGVLHRGTIGAKSVPPPDERVVSFQRRFNGSIQREERQSRRDPPLSPTKLSDVSIRLA